MSLMEKSREYRENLILPAWGCETFTFVNAIFKFYNIPT